MKVNKIWTLCTINLCHCLTGRPDLYPVSPKIVANLLLSLPSLKANGVL